MGLHSECFGAGHKVWREIVSIHIPHNFLTLGGREAATFLMFVTIDAPLHVETTVIFRHKSADKEPFPGGAAKAVLKWNYCPRPLTAPLRHRHSKGKNERTNGSERSFSRLGALHSVTEISFRPFVGQIVREHGRGLLTVQQETRFG